MPWIRSSLVAGNAGNRPSASRTRLNNSSKADSSTRDSALPSAEWTTEVNQDDFFVEAELKRRHEAQLTPTSEADYGDAELARFQAMRAASEERSQRSGSQDTRGSRPSASERCPSKRERSLAATREEERVNYNPVQIAAYENDELTYFDFHGNQVPDINYGPVGTFKRLPWESDEEILESLAWLEQVGQMIFPDFRTCKELIQFEQDGRIKDGNASMMGSYIPHHGVLEIDSLISIATFNGKLTWPNNLIRAWCPSYKNHMDLVPDIAGHVGSLAHTGREEWLRLDGQIFFTTVSVQIAIAFQDYFGATSAEGFPLKIKSYDPIALGNPEQEIKAEIVMARMGYPQIAIPTTWVYGQVRLNDDCQRCPGPDNADPGWSVDNEGNWSYEVLFISRKDWDTDNFYMCGVSFQKHNNRKIRTTDLHTGKQVPNRSLLQIKPWTPYEFINRTGGPRSSQGSVHRARSVQDRGQASDYWHNI